MFSIQPAPSSPDLEALLVETARDCSDNSRLFTMAATWLSLYGDAVSSDRLAELLDQEGDERIRPILGLLLDQVRAISGSTHFDGVIARCRPAPEPGPLFAIERRNDVLWKIAEKHASPLSKKWNLWARPLEPKYNAIRPAWWIAAHNPGFGIDAVPHSSQGTRPDERLFGLGADRPSLSTREPGPPGRR
jgi:hypothetical protein